MSDPERTQADPANPEALLDEVLARPGVEQAAALDAICAAHPDVGEIVRRRFHALGALGLLDADTDEAPPDRLGDFVLLERIGSGGMGVVYRARQEPLGREVALKLVRPELVYFEKTRTRFAREAEAVARLDHPGIVPVYTVGEARGIPFLAMQLVDGATLAEIVQALWGRDAATLSADAVLDVLAASARIDASAPPAWCEASWARTATRLALQVADALTHAHARGIVHRDVKPGNVMVARDGRVLLLDFGLALADDAQGFTRTGTVMGSFAYASPEQVQGQRADARSDVFSLGSVLYELLALRPPFAGASTKETIERVLGRDPSDLARNHPRVDKALAAIVRKAIEKVPAARYQSMAAFTADLRAWLAGGAVSVQSDTALRRLRRFVRREPLRAGALASCVVAALASAGWVGSWLANREPLAVGRARLRQEAVEREVLAGFVDLAHGHRTTARAAFLRAQTLDPADTEAAAGLAALEPGTGSGPRPDPDAATPAALFRYATARLFQGPRGDLTAAREASECIAQAVDRSPVARPVYHFLWLAAAATAHDEAAVREAAAAVAQLWPTSVFTHYWIGHAFLELDPPRALASLRAALSQSPDFHRARGDLGVALLACGDPGAAANELDAVVTAEPGNARAWIDLGIAHERRGDPAAALRALRAATAADPDLPGAWYNLARMQALTDDPEGARAGYQRTLTLAPDYAEAHLNLGLLLSDAGEHPAALTHLGTATTLRSEWADAHRALGFACAKAGDGAGARRACLEVVRLLPDDDDAHDDLCKLLTGAEHADALVAEQERWRTRTRKPGR